MDGIKLNKRERHEALLELFKQHGHTGLSKTKLAKRFGVTRKVIWSDYKEICTKMKNIPDWEIHANLRTYIQTSRERLQRMIDTEEKKENPDQKLILQMQREQRKISKFESEIADIFGLAERAPQKVEIDIGWSSIIEEKEKSKLEQMKTDLKKKKVNLEELV